MTKRVYHPDLNAWEDVDDKAVESWAKEGWLKGKPKHVTGDLPPVGEHPGFVSIPVLEAPSSTPTATRSAGGSARTSSSSRTAGGSKTGRGSGSTAPSATGGTSAGSTT